MAAFCVAGTLIVKAADNPMIVEGIQRFNRPLRQAVEPYLPRPQAQLPRIFQRKAHIPVQALGYAPQTERLRPLPRLTPERALPVGALPKGAQSGRSVAKTPAIRGTGGFQGRHKLQSRGIGRGAPVAMNYCVRLCDGFAFPIGQANSGNWRVQEQQCGAICPGAQTALFHSPAGAKDFDSMTRGRQLYSALPTAFQYRTKLSQACTCRPAGSTQSSTALLRDPTLRKGDLAMTRIGVRHFDGARSLPYRAAQFSDALARLKSRKEIAEVRAMEAVSVKGVQLASVGPKTRSRIIADIRKAQAAVVPARPNDGFGLPSGFVELRARAQRPVKVLRVVKRAPGLVAMN